MLLLVWNIISTHFEMLDNTLRPLIFSQLSLVLPYHEANRLRVFTANRKFYDHIPPHHHLDVPGKSNTPVNGIHKHLEKKTKQKKTRNTESESRYAPELIARCEVRTLHHRLDAPPGVKIAIEPASVPQTKKNIHTLARGVLIDARRLPIIIDPITASPHSISPSVSFHTALIDCRICQPNCS